MNLLNPIGLVLLLVAWLQRRKARRQADALVAPHVRDLADASVEPNVTGGRDRRGTVR